MEYSMCACHFLLFPELWIIFEMWSNFKTKNWGMGFFVALCELFNVVRYFVNDVTWQNTLPQVKDVQLPHYCISKSYVAFQDILAVTNACPSIFSKLFTVNKVKFIVNVIFSSLTMMAFTLFLFIYYYLLFVMH